jgi:flagellin-like hook-associated protein FlgL
MNFGINHNLMAMNVSRNLGNHYQELGVSTRRLSSGLRIGTAADDAAGLAVRELMRSDVSTLNQGVRNANDAISMIQTADGALEVIDEKLIRMKELAEQAATGTYTSDQRMIISSEFQAMASEIQRIAVATDFNGNKLLDNSLANATGAWGWSNPALSAAHNGTSLDSTGPAKIHFGTGNSSAEDYYYVGVSNSQIGAILEPNGVTENGDEFQINTYSASVQANPSVTGLANGGYVATWQSVGQDGDDFGIFAKVYDKDGKAQTGDIQVNSYTTWIQSLPVATSLADGGFLISWNSDSQPPDGSSWGVFARRYNASGEPAGNEFLVNTSTSNAQNSPSVTGLPDGGYVATWMSSHTGDANIYKQQYDKTGAAVGAEMLVSSVPGTQHTPSVTSLQSGGYAITWRSDQNGTNDIYFRMYGADGNPIAAEAIVNDVQTGNQIDPKITTLKNGNFVVAYSSDSSGANDIFYQMFDSNGNKLGSNKMANSYTALNQQEPSATSLAGGGFMLSWSSQNQDGSGYGIYGQQFDSNGSAVGEEVKISTESNDDQRRPSISGLTDGGVVAVWHSMDQDGSSWGVFGQRYSPTFNINTQESAQNYLDNLNDAAVQINANRAGLGSTQNRLENTITNLQIQAENLQDAESQISDVDVANEMTNFVKEQILSQAATAMLAQANSIPKMAVQLISGG